MSTVARFDTDRFDVTPGTQTTVQLHVGNQGQIVEEYRFEPVGDLAAHIVVRPESLSLYPNTDGLVQVEIHLPEHSAVRAGEVPLAVVVQPQGQDGEVAVPETTAVVLPYRAVEAEMIPRTSQARLWSKHSVAVDNRGNRVAHIRLTAADPDALLTLRCKPEHLSVRPGEALFSTVRVRTRKVMWRGSPATRPFELSIAPEDDNQFTLPGQVVQEAIFPRGTGKLLAGLAAAAVALVVLWFALLRPTITSAAQDAVAEPLRQVREQAEQAQQQAKEASQQAGLSAAKSQQASQDARQAGGGGQAPGEALAGGAAAGAAAVADGQSPATTLRPLNRRLIVNAAPNQTETAQFAVPQGQVVSITDLVFESRGDAGTVQLLRDSAALITAQSEDFRTLDQHFVSPIIYTEGQQITFRLSCREPAPNQQSCQSALYLGGEQAPKPRPVREDGN